MPPRSAFRLAVGAFLVKGVGMKTYSIIIFYADLGKENEVLATGLTLEEAQEHCQGSETSSRSATGEEARKRTELHGPWFHGYSEE